MGISLKKIGHGIGRLFGKHYPGDQIDTGGLNSGPMYTDPATGAAPGLDVVRRPPVGGGGPPTPFSFMGGGEAGPGGFSLKNPLPAIGGFVKANPGLIPAALGAGADIYGYSQQGKAADRANDIREKELAQEEEDRKRQEKIEQMNTLFQAMVGFRPRY